MGSVLKEIFTFFTYCFYGIPNGIFRAAAEFSNFRIALPIQSKKKRPLLLHLRAAFQRRYDFLQGFLATRPLFRRFGVALALAGDDGFVEFPPVPMPPFSMGKVFTFTFDGIEESINFYIVTSTDTTCPLTVIVPPWSLSFLKDFGFQKG